MIPTIIKIYFTSILKIDLNDNIINEARYLTKILSYKTFR